MTSGGTRASGCPTGTAAGLRRTVLAGALAAIVGIVAVSPAQATSAAQEEARRRKQIEVFERLLTETVHDYAQTRVGAGDRTVSDGDAAAGNANAPTRDDRLIVRVAAANPAHGVYLDGYGVIFSIQTQQVSVIPQSFQVRLSEPLEVYEFGAAANGNLHRVNTGIIEFRAGRIGQSLRELEELLQRELEQGADSELTDLHLRKIEDMRAMLANLSRVRERAPESSEGQESIDTGEKGRDAVRTTAGRHAGDRRQRYLSVLELQRSATQLLERSNQQLSGAVNEAAIETLAQYGSVIKGLDSDDRVSVLIISPPRWTFGPTRRVNQQDEYVISVRYKDIRDFDNQKIDLEEFRSRVRIHSRLGTAIELSQPQQ